MPKGVYDRGNTCKNGHEFTLENTYIKPDGARQCRLCGNKRTRAWRKQNPETVRKSNLRNFTPEKLRKWRRANPEKMASYERNRRALEKGSVGAFTAQEWEALCKKYHNKCLHCKRRRKLTADHVIPLLCGGSNNIGNIQPLCGPCNSSKGTKTIDYRT
jgi:5-methylcytosine-specific restriction endonuclease McrA